MELVSGIAATPVPLDNDTPELPQDPCVHQNEHNAYDGFHQDNDDGDCERESSNESEAESGLPNVLKL